MSRNAFEVLFSRLIHRIWLPVAGLVGCCAMLVGAIFCSSIDAYADSCRTLIYRADTAGVDSQYVQICPDGDGVRVNTSDTLEDILGINVQGQTRANDAPAVEVLVENKDDVHQRLFRYTGGGGTSCNGDEKNTECISSYSDLTTTVFNNASDRVGDSVNKNGVTYSYNGIYEGSYIDWQNAGSPGPNGELYDTEETTEETEDSSDTSETDPCYNASESLGWIVCPLMNWVSSALSELYSDIVEPFLQVDSDVFKQFNDQGEAVGTYKAWSIFRDMANIVFVILVIIVILSQVTGFGISNYGIKKALPKIVVIAILVNLSYIACELAVDVSNILGFSAETLLSSAANTVAGTGSGGGGDTASTAFSSIIGVGAAAGGIVALGVAASAAGVVVVLLTLLMALISIVFFFVVLGLRQAGIVLLVALAPLAIVCFALPNTEKVAKRWLGMLKALLFVYPIAGVLIGGGHLAAQILLAVSSEWTFQVIAMLLFVVPFLALPSLLKKSIAGADQIFGSIVNKGEGLTGAAQGKIRGSQMMQKNQQKMQQTRLRRTTRAKTLAAGLLGDTNTRFGRFAQRKIMTNQAANIRQVAANKTEELQDYLGNMIDPNTGGHDNDKIQKTWQALAEKAAGGATFSRTEQKTWQAIADYSAKTGDAGTLVKMARSGSNQTKQLLSQRAQANHDIIDVMGGKKGDKALADHLESGHANGQGGWDYSKSLEQAQAEAVGKMGATDIAAQDTYARKRMLEKMPEDTLLTHLNSGALKNAPEDGRLAFEERAKGLGLQKSNTGRWYRPRS